ncbi:hypothetical protein ABE67_23090 [Cytobacillus firmus]|uniref:hypothetical protein n=1 Tax=Cytobacillus firmus TaxID=1399 RepID=UPI0018CEF610|nr:hypothetical protein [Cytobacillus firmus]MBG9452160.1 hypothetical protein [Cytobacillus firmus]
MSDGNKGYILNEEFYLKEQEVILLKKELNIQLNLREAELKEYSKLLSKYEQLEKKYNSLRNSSLGKLTVRYWQFRKKLKGNNSSKGAPKHER